MMHENYPVTTAIRFLRERGISFEPHLYPYQEHGGTAHAAAMLHVDEYAVVKTLVMETDQGTPLIVLMHGDHEVSTKQLGRMLNVKSVSPCTPEAATKHTGYLVGGTSPFGTKKQLPVFVEGTIFALPRIYVNGGKRGFLISIPPQVLKDAVSATEVHVAIIPDGSQRL